MSRLLRTQAVFIRLAFVQWLAARGFMLSLVTDQAITPLIGLAVWTAAVPGNSRITTYYTFMLFVQLVTVSYENHTFSNRIYQGELADDLLRPCPVILQPLGQNLAIRACQGVMGAPLLLAVALLVPVRTSWPAIMLAIPALILAAGLRFLYTYILALSALWTERAHSVVGFGWTLVFLLGGGAAPVPLMPGGLRHVAQMLPFRSMQGFPAEIGAQWLGAPAVAQGFAVQLGWLCAFGALAALVWQAGINRYAAVGS